MAYVQSYKGQSWVLPPEWLMGSGLAMQQKVKHYQNGAGNACPIIKLKYGEVYESQQR